MTIRHLAIALVLPVFALATTACGGKKATPAGCEEVFAYWDACAEKVGGSEGGMLKKQADNFREEWSKPDAGDVKSSCDYTLKDLKKRFGEKCGK